MAAEVRDGGYYGRPGYLHRYYLFCSPYWKKAQSISVNPQEDKIRAAIESFKEKENAALIDFCSLFTSEEVTPEKGIEILNNLLTDTNKVFDEIWKELSSRDKLNRTVLDSVKEISKKALHETIEKGKTDNNQEVISQIKSTITRSMNRLLGVSEGMMVSGKSATLGNWFERYFSTLINATYMTKITKEQTRTKKMDKKKLQFRIQ